MDGRPLPASVLSRGGMGTPWRWDGGTLVVDTSGFKDGGWLDVNGAPLTDAAKMSERFRRGHGTLGSR
jgi:hypothetical protein